jgi:flagellar biosynthesis/type III secretory pathway protein FliH
MGKNSRRKVPPSRVKYEKNNPVISFRVPIDIFNRIQHVKKVGENSFANVFMAGLGKMEARGKKLEGARSEGYNQGYQKGYADAKLKYRITCNCDICGQEIEVIQPSIKQSVRQYLKGWAHQECLERRRSSLSQSG